MMLRIGMYASAALLALMLVWHAVWRPFAFLIRPFNPATSADDRLWALRSFFGDPQVCPYEWGGPEGNLMVHDCAPNMDAAVDMAWRVHTINAVLAILWLALVVWLAARSYYKTERR